MARKSPRRRFCQYIINLDRTYKRKVILKKPIFGGEILALYGKPRGTKVVLIYDNVVPIDSASNEEYLIVWQVVGYICTVKSYGCLKIVEM